MTSKARQKGYRSVATCRKILEKDGFIVANLEKTGKFAKEKDLFGLWDILAIRDKYHLFIQVKTNLSPGKKKPTKWTLPYIAFGKEHESELVKYQIWIKMDNAGIIVVECK